jgi:hypothetical protein
VTENASPSSDRIGRARGAQLVLRRGYRVPYDELRPRWVVPYGPWTAVLFPDCGTCSPGACYSATACPWVVLLHLIGGGRVHEHQRGFRQFTRLIFPWAVGAGMEPAPLGFSADQEPDDVRRGRGQAVEQTRNNPLRHQANPQSCVVTHVRASSRRTVRSSSELESADHAWIRALHRRREVAAPQRGGLG